MTTITHTADGPRFDGMTVGEIIDFLGLVGELGHAPKYTCDRAIAALRHLSAQLAGEPIDSAPTDGTYILVRLPAGHVTIAQFCADGYWRRNAWDDYGCEPDWWWKLPAGSAQGGGA